MDFTSDCLLGTEQYKDQPLLVATDGIWAQYKALVYDGAHTVGDMKMPLGESGDDLETHTGAKVKHEWMNPEKLFFTENVLQMSVSDKVVRANKNDYILPLRREVLQYFTPKELKESFAWQDAPGGGLVAELTVPLRSTDKSKRPKDVKVTHTYKVDDIVKLSEREAPPVIALWPDFRAEGWKHNYCYAWMNPEVGLSLEPVDSVEHVKRPGSPWEGEVWRTDQLTAGFECRFKKGREELKVGLIVPDPAGFPVPGRSAYGWDVGVDFRTDYTTLTFRHMPDSRPMPVTVKDRVVFLTTFPNIAGRNRVVGDYIKPSFMPAESTGWPAIPSSGIVLSTCVEYNAVQNPRLILDVSFVPLDCLPGWQFFITGSNVISGLEWAKDTHRRSVISVVLKHLLLLVGAEARSAGANEVAVHWSYPGALPTTMLNDMESKWQTITQAFNDTGLRFTVAEHVTEAEAVCRYFHYACGAPLGQNALVTVDIGTGATNIAIWQDGQLRQQTAFLLAGSVVPAFLGHNRGAWRELLIDVMQHPPESWPQWEAIWAPAEQMDALTRTLDLLSRSTGPRFLDNLAMPQGAPGSFVPRIRSVLLFAYAGIAHFVGLCLRRLPDGVRGRLGCEVLLGGRHVKYLDWIGSEVSVSPAIAAIIARAAAPHVKMGDGQPTVRLSNAIAQETALGLLYPSVVGESQSTPRADRILGEDGYEWDGVLLPPHFDLNFDDVPGISLTVPDRFPELERFLAEYDELAARFNTQKLSGLVNYQDIKHAIVDRLHETTSNSPGSMAYEGLDPLFIEEVKAVVERYLLGIGQRE
jgi:hypothetical protein